MDNQNLNMSEDMETLKEILDIVALNRREIRAVEMAIDTLKSHLKDRWIPVGERLPDVRQRENGEPIEFIVMIKDAVVPTLLSIDDNGNWFDWMCCYHNVPEYLSSYYDVVAWQPLPEPYKGE